MRDSHEKGAGTRDQLTPKILPNSVHLEQGTIVQFDWLLACQTKYHMVFYDVPA